MQKPNRAQENNIRLIPEPQQLYLREGKFLIDGQCIILAKDGTLGPEADFLQRKLVELSGVRVPIAKDRDVAKDIKRVNLNILNNDNLSWEKCLDKEMEINKLGREAYILNISKQNISVSGMSAAGVFYGIQTLLQLMESNVVRCMEVIDWPALSIRGVHFDLKKQMPTFDYLKETIKRLSQYKINAILMEYEDKFPYLKFLRDRGFEIIAAPSVRECAGLPIPNHKRCIPNITKFIEKAIEHKIMGTVVTSWSALNGTSPVWGAPFETTWYGLIAAAECAWGGQEFRFHKDRFNQKFVERFYGTKGDEIIKGIYLLSNNGLTSDERIKDNAQKALEILEKFKDRIKKHKLNLEYLLLAARINLHMSKRIQVFREIESQSERIDSGEPDIIEKMISLLGILRAELQLLKEDTGKIFEKTIRPEDVKEALLLLFEAEENRIHHCLFDLTKLRGSR